MTKTETYLALGGAVVCSALICGIAAVSSTSGKHTRQSVADAGRVPVSAPVRVRDGQTVPVVADSRATAMGDLLPVEGAMVSDQTLLRLSGMVNIANSVNEQPNKKEWQEALPVAEKLLGSPCDCAQRNWLKRFVEMGNAALHGTEQEYKESAQVIVTLGRNNNQAVAISKGGY